MALPQKQDPLEHRVQVEEFDASKDSMFWAGYLLPHINNPCTNIRCYLTKPGAGMYLAATSGYGPKTFKSNAREYPSAEAIFQGVVPAKIDDGYAVELIELLRVIEGVEVRVTINRTHIPIAFRAKTGRAIQISVGNATRRYRIERPTQSAPLLSP